VYDWPGPKAADSGERSGDTFAGLQMGEDDGFGAEQLNCSLPE
jgi:hypothetical protein